MHVDDILRGACDIHVHASPSLMARELDSFEMARRASKAGYAAIVLKDHHSNTAPVAAEIMENLKLAPTFQVFGSICLNNAVGGINPFAVEAAILFGAKTIWLPTTSAENHLEKLRNNTFPHSALKLAEPPVRVTDGGRLLPEVCAALKLIAEAPGTLLGMGHISARDIDAVLDKAVGFGIKSILINHPTYIVEATRTDMTRWAGAGAYIEHTATGSLPGSAVFHTGCREISELIGLIGSASTIISSDAGQRGNGCPIEVLGSFLELLSDYGISDSDISTMVRENPRKLLGLENKE